jgi:hypothetical protein
MKKTLVTIAAVAICINSVKAQDKAFKKGDIVVDLGVGFAVYGTKNHNEYNSRVWNGTSISTVRITEDTTDATASSIIPISVEYGITNWFGVGARFGYSKYIASSDSTNNFTKPTVRGLDADLLLNFHLVKTKRFDMPLSLIIGYSNFKYKANNPNTNPANLPDNGNAMAKDNGLNYGISLVPRIYFGDHIGMFFNVGYMGFNYGSITFSNNSDSNLNDDDNQDQLFKLKGNGVNVGIGLVAKF